MSDIEETKQVEEEPITKKDPRRVEQGKRLAMISREAKERKMRARLEKEKEENRSWSNHIPTIVAVGSSFGFLTMLFLFWSRKPERVIIREERNVESDIQKKKFVNSNKNFEEL